MCLYVSVAVSLSLLSVSVFSSSEMEEVIESRAELLTNHIEKLSECCAMRADREAGR